MESVCAVSFSVKHVIASCILVVGRTMTFYKTLPYTVIQATYFDLGGFHMTGAGSSWGLRWRLCIDSCTYVSRPFSSHTDNQSGWRMTPMTMQWYFDNVPVGAHTLTVQ